MAHLLIPLHGSSEYGAQFPVFVPASVIAERQTFKLNQFAQGLFKDWFQGFDVSAAVFIDFSAGLAQFPVPNRLRNGVKCTMPQPGVSLAQGLLQTLPSGHEPWLDVEHAPVEKLPANLRRTFKQTEAVGVDQLQWQDLRQLRGAAGVLAVDADLELTLTITRDPQRAMATLG